MAIERNIPRHPYYQRVFHVKLPRSAMSRTFIDTKSFASSIPVEPYIQGLPVILRNPYIGTALIVQPAPMGGNPAPVRTFEWYADADMVSTSQALMLTDTHLGKTITVKQIATNSEGAAEAVSAPKGPVTPQPVAPSITGFPTISGTPAVSNVLTATPAPVTGYPTPTRAWQWSRNEVIIDAANASTYTVASADIGQQLRVHQTETNSEGALTSVSAPTDPVTDIINEDISWHTFDTEEELAPVVAHFVNDHGMVLPEGWSAMSLQEKIAWLIAHT